MNTSLALAPLDLLFPAGPPAGVEGFGSMAVFVGLVVTVAALLCAAVAGILLLFPRLLVRTSDMPVDASTGEVLPVFPETGSEVRRRARPILRAALIWACGGAVLALIGAIVGNPMLIFPTLSMLIAAGVLLVIVAGGYRLAGTRTHNGIHIRHLIYTGTITVLVATSMLLLLSLIFTSPAAATAMAAIGMTS